MKLLLITFFSLLTLPLTWMGNFDEALKQAATSHKQILIVFSGSDWCGPCIRMKKEILETATFEEYASKHLLLVRADFPRQKKNKLSAEQLKLNEALAEHYNPDGKFPYTVLTDEHGHVIKSWDGLPQESPDEFVQQLAQAAIK